MNIGTNVITDGLVFGYDINSNYYKGEPTTNLTPYSQDFSFWSKQNVTITSGSTTAPDGTFTGSLWSCTNATNHQLYKSHDSSGAYRTLSAYVKKATHRGCYLGAYNTNYYAYYDMDTCIVTSTIGSGAKASIEPVGNDWYRISIYVPSINGELQVGFLDSAYVGTSTSPWAVSTAIGTSGYIWGVQIEYKKHRTQYVKTSGVSESRLSTNSLIDLTKNYTIDLTNTNFDSTAHPYFSGGTGEKIITNFTSQLNDFTACAWYKSMGKSPSSYDRLLDKRYDSGFSVMRDAGSNNRWGGSILNSSSPYGIYLTLPDGYWHYIVTMRSGSTHYLYGDGVTNKISEACSTSPLSSNSLAIGSWADTSSAQSFIGQIPIVQLYNRALSEDEIMQNYNAHKSIFK